MKFAGMMARAVFALWWVVMAVALAETLQKPSPPPAADVGLLKAENAALRALNAKLAVRLEAYERLTKLEEEGKKVLAEYEQTAKDVARRTCKEGELWEISEGAVKCRPAPVPAAASPPKEK